MIPGIDLKGIVDAVAERLLEKLREDGGMLAGGTGCVRPRLLTVDQAAVYIGRSKDAVQHMVTSGKIPTVRSDRRVFIDVEDLDGWIREHKQAGL